MLETVRYVNYVNCMRYLFYRPLYGIVPLAYSGPFSACFFE